ncbi:thioredoxin reductase [Methanomassiliicoccales archaeon RumEn M1]|nr:thioredoxin reductase [Methanomassiliicoccales archaeon RumEn M1]
MDVDVAIIGLGPAGLQAAIHAARKKVKVVVLGKSESSALNKAEIENYFGIVSAKGEDLLRIGREQAQRFGASLVEEDVIKLAKEEDVFKIVTETDREVRAKAVILAMGIRRVKLNVPGEKEFLGRGVSYCASCDGGFFRDRAVAVIGEESEAAESAILLTEYASQVYWVHRELKVSPQMLEKASGTKVEMVPGDPARILGEKSVTGLDLKDGRHLDVQGVFVALGAKGSMELALELGILPDPSGKITVDENCRTEMEMVYACGDVTGSPWQLARAVGQGAVAGDNAAKAVRQQEKS